MTRSEQDKAMNIIVWISLGLWILRLFIGGWDG
jgi:hypothetical protein